MPFSSRRISTAVAMAAIGTIGLAFAASACDRPHHDAPSRAVPTPTVIVVPRPDQVTGTIDASDMNWLSRIVGTGSAAAGR